MHERFCTSPLCYAIIFLGVSRDLVQYQTIIKMFQVVSDHVAGFSYAKTSNVGQILTLENQILQSLPLSFILITINNKLLTEAI